MGEGLVPAGSGADHPFEPKVTVSRALKVPRVGTIYIPER
jgi:hypothetical protein